MPAKSVKQQRFMGAELARARAGKKTRTGMSKSEFKEFAETKHKGLPMKKRKAKDVRTKKPRPRG